MRRLVIRENLGDILKIIAINAEETRLSLSNCDGRGARYRFNEVWSFAHDANGAFTELRALSPFRKEGPR